MGGLGWWDMGSGARGVFVLSLEDGDSGVWGLGPEGFWVLTSLCMQGTSWDFACSIRSCSDRFGRLRSSLDHGCGLVQLLEACVWARSHVPCSGQLDKLHCLRFRVQGLGFGVQGSLACSTGRCCNRGRAGMGCQAR